MLVFDAGVCLIMKCPKCKTETLVEFLVEDVTVDRCPSCAGIWFDRQELSELLAEDARRVAELRRSSENEAAEEIRGDCPRDASPLTRVYSSIDRSVILDACADCHGIWLDGGEFDKLFAARRK
jgi:Zn-finger nucleic acid-binding protein